jgi:predicted O-methyltransferase YrrM
LNTSAFATELRRCFDGDLRADHPVERRFGRLLGDVEGFATENMLTLLSAAARLLPDGEAYLEVGSFRGLSIIAALLEAAHDRFYAIENFQEFDPDGNGREQLFANLDRWGVRHRLHLMDGDCFSLLRRRPPSEPVGVYFYDGSHGRLAHYLAISEAEPLLADEALVIVDDASWPIVRDATERYMRAHPGYELLFDLASDRDEDPRWWNGVRVYRFRRTGDASSVDWAVFWRRAFYRLAYRPVMAVAWKTLTGRPRLAGVVLKLVPLASRRVARE